MLRAIGPCTDVDVDLVAALRRGDSDAGVQLVERYGERVYRLAARVTGTSDAAEEAAQSALVEAADTIDAFKSDARFSSWIDRLAARAAYRALLTRPATPRSGNAEEIALDDVLPPLDGDGVHFEPMRDWSDRIDARELEGDLRRALTDAVDSLPADYRVSMVLHDVEGMAAADIAEALGVAPASVRAHVHRARLFVRKCLSERLVSA